ncbi:hypothetical protein VRRI112168_20030 [Vreelandella rituensis]
MKAHIGIDAVTELTYSIAANVADVTMAGHLVRDKDNRVYGDAGYIVIQKYLGETKDTQDYRCCVTATSSRRNCSPCFSSVSWCWLADAKTMLTGPICLEYGLAAA